MIIAVGNDAQFARLCAAAELPELANDAKYATNSQRVLNRTALIDALCRATRTRTTQEWVCDLERVGVPCGPINTIDAVFADPQVKARQMQIELPHPLAGPIPLVGNPLRLSATPVSYRTAPPVLGAQTREVLKSRLGLSDSDLDALAAKEVI